MSDTFAEIQKLVAEQFEMDPGLITRSATLESLQIDSISASEFLFLLEDKYGIKYPEQGERPKTIGDIVDEVDKLVKGRKGVA